METVKFPSDYQQLMPYLIVEDAAGFMQFTQDVFGATEKLKHMRDEKLIAHAEVKIGESVIMFGDALEQWKPITGSFFVYVADADATFKKAIDRGSKVVDPIADKPYGRSGGVIDPWGNAWWITTHTS